MALNTQIQIGRAEGGTVIVLVKRGVCTFVEKAKNVQAAVHASDGRKEKGIAVVGGMVLVNGEDLLADMPAGNLLTDDITIPVAM